MTRRSRLAFAWFGIGMSGTLVVVGYFAWVMSLNQPVDWVVALQMALFFGPVIAGGLAGFAWMDGGLR